MDQNTRNWIADRAENRESLMYGEFIKNMKEIETPARTLAKYRTKKYKQQVKARYKKASVAERKVKRRLFD
jgi:hypothetical protein